MANLGINGLYWFEMDSTTDVPGETVPTYKPPVKIAKAIQLTLTPNNVDGNLYADDSQDEYESFTTGFDLSLNVNHLLPGKESLLLGRREDELGGVAAHVNDSAPFGALAYRMPRSKGVGGGYQYRVLYKTRFTPFAEDAQTKGESVNFQTPTLTGKAISRNYDGNFNYKLDDDGTKEAVKAVTANWFKNVIEPAGEIEEG